MVYIMGNFVPIREASPHNVTAQTGLCPHNMSNTHTNNIHTVGRHCLTGSASVVLAATPPQLQSNLPTHAHTNTHTQAPEGVSMLFYGFHSFHSWSVFKHIYTPLSHTASNWKCILKPVRVQHKNGTHSHFYSKLKSKVFFLNTQMCCTPCFTLFCISSHLCAL